MEDRKSVSGSALCAQANSLAECYALTLCNMWVGTRQPYMRSLRGSRVLTQLEQQILRQKKSWSRWLFASYGCLSERLLILPGHKEPFIFNCICLITNRAECGKFNSRTCISLRCCMHGHVRHISACFLDS